MSPYDAVCAHRNSTINVTDRIVHIIVEGDSAFCQPSVNSVSSGWHNTLSPLSMSCFLYKETMNYIFALQWLDVCVLLYNIYNDTVKGDSVVCQPEETLLTEG